ncbi:MAG: hypothetical protein IT435_13205 [Phycisphaerales bacterium]|nr:hypothetical protein [Phycisphaerales bacterium]
MKRFFGYVASFEVAQKGSVRVDVELVDERWMRDVLEREIPLVYDELRQLFANVPVWPTLYTLPLAVCSGLAATNLWFALRTIDGEHPAPISLARLTLPRAHSLLKTLVESSWIGVILDDAEAMIPGELEPPDGYAFHTTLGVDASGDRGPTKNRIVEIQNLPPNMNAVLQALHLPQVDPTLLFVGGISVAPSPVLPPGGTSPQHQPFVGAMNTGQGACAGVWGHDGQLAAILDCGVPININAGTRPPAASFPSICACDDPLVVLSHWDHDHYMLARSKIEMYQLRWIVPQQHLGTPALTVCARIIWDGISGSGNGQLLLWQSPPATGSAVPQQPPASEHIWLPWGVLERCLGSMRDKNDSGCAAFVLVNDASPVQRQYPAILGRRGSKIVSPNTHKPPTMPRAMGSYNMQGLLTLGRNLIAPVPGVAAGPISGTAKSQGYILAPGDAAFEHIPTIKAGANFNVVGLMAIHHGATFWKAPASSFTPPSTHADGRIIYSYGMHRPSHVHCHRNSTGFGHPTPAAITEYEKNGWTYRLNTCEIAHLSSQPPILGPARPNPKGAQAIGNAAIGWQAGTPISHDITPAGSQPPSQPIERTCSTCGTIYQFQF